MILGELAGLSAALLWSNSSYVFTAVVKRVGAVQLSVDRMIVSSVLLVITAYFFNLSYNLTLNQIFFLSLSGFIGLSIGDSFLFKAFQMIGPRLSMLLMALAPAFSSILAYFILNEHLMAWDIIGMIVTLIGVSIVVLENRSEEDKIKKVSFLGIFFGVLAALGQGVGLIFSKIAFWDGEINSFVATLIRLVAGTITLIPIGILFKKYTNPVKIYSKDMKLFGLLTLGAIIGPYLGITASFIAILYTKVGIAATLMSTAPVIMLPMAHYIFKEKLSFRAVLGAIIAVAGVSLLFLTH